VNPAPDGWYVRQRFPRAGILNLDSTYTIVSFIFPTADEARRYAARQPLEAVWRVEHWRGGKFVSTEQ
jgi:hypothetical protein